MDRAFVYVAETGEASRTDLDIQYRICYQFLRHSFGIKHLPRANNSFDQIYIRLDSHSSQEHTESLKQFAQDLPKSLGRTDLVVDVSFVNSKKHLRLQLCDVLMGATGSHGNKMHLRREPDQRGMTAKQKTRHDLSKHIYSKFKELDRKTRGTNAFNWFESTGHDGNSESRLLHKVRIWKFKPEKYRLDKGWQNDHLDKQGRYQKPDVLPEIFSA